MIFFLMLKKFSFDALGVCRLMLIKLFFDTSPDEEPRLQGPPPGLEKEEIRH